MCEVFIVSNIIEKEINNLYLKYNSSNLGLNSNVVILNREKYGTNQIQKEKKQTFIKKFLLQFKNLMVIVLLISAIVSGTIAVLSKNYSDLFESGLILIIVIANSLIGALQERKAENTLSLLEKQTISHAKVIRNGKLLKIEISDIVVGDIVELKTGDFVPADIRLIQTNNFSCDESSLTGESKKVKKDENFIPKANTILSDKKHMTFKGTTVASGNAIGIVTAVGVNAEIGKIAKLIESGKKEKTPLEKNIDRIGKVITIGVTIIVVIVFLVQLIFSNKINFGDAFMTAIALAVAAIPESLPAVITIIMALGVQRLARHNAIVKTLSSVETLGCCTCICSDKTGTLTQNKMSVVHLYSTSKIYSKPTEINSFSLNKILEISSLCSNVKLLENNNLEGDATEKALYNLCKTCNFDIDKLKQENTRVFENPFDSTKKFMTTIYKNKNNEFTCYAKGACDVLLDKCSYILLGDKVVKLTNTEKQKILKAHSTFSNNAERVILLAYKPTSSNKDNIENDFIFVSLLGLIDPPRPEVYKAVNDCYTAGLKPVMITGDHKETAFKIAQMLNICKKPTQVITGKELDNLSQKDLEKIISKYCVFARVTPEHKSRIVKAFKANGQIVAMTGDGINDAPSIKQADIGTCMGTTGTDVTKSVSDIIITDDNFSSIVIAVSTGRTIYNNIQKTLQFLISTNAVEVLGLFIVSILMRDSIFLLPSQILFINLVTDSLPAFALGIEPPEKDIMKKPPRPTKDTIFSGEVGTAIIYQAFVQTFVVLILFVFAYHSYGNEIATSMSFITICLMQILHAVNCKTNKSLFSINIFKNKMFNLSFIALLILILSVGLIPPLQNAFSIVPLNLFQWIIVILSSISIIPLVELFKLILNHKKRHV